MVRIHTIVIAVVIMSLFGVMLFKVTNDFFTAVGIDSENLTSSGLSGNQSHFLREVTVLNNMSQDLATIADYGVAGDKVTSTAEDTSYESTLSKSGLSFTARLAQFLYVYPKTILTSAGAFLGIDPLFITVAIALLTIVVAIILISSVLRNVL